MYLDQLLQQQAFKKHLLLKALHHLHLHQLKEKKESNASVANRKPASLPTACVVRHTSHLWAIQTVKPTCRASVGRIPVSDKTFNTPVIAIHCSNAQNVGFENPTYAKFKKAASVGRILVSDKTFNILVVAIHCSNAQNVGFENPAYKIIPSIIL